MKDPIVPFPGSPAVLPTEALVDVAAQDAARTAADTAVRGYAGFADRLLAGGLVNDPWLDGAPRFRAEPQVLSAEDAQELAAAAEEVAAVVHEACCLCQREPELLDDFLGLTPYQKAMWLASAPSWHGIARADVFRTAQGFVVCELNGDTPTGEAEAVELGRLALASRPELVDPNASLAGRFVGMVEALARAGLAEPSRLDEPARRNAALVYPTEMPEDLALVRVYRAWLEAAGWNVVLGSPYNLGGRVGETPTLFGVPCPLVVRHYKTDWWGERAPVWLDEEAPPDAEPLDGPLSLLLQGSLAGQVAVVNPFGAVVAQNKRLFALCWEHKERFSPWARASIEARIPETLRLESMHPAQLLAEQHDWVLKSDYGCEGEEVVLGAAVTPELWQRTLAAAAPRRFVVQRRFDALCNDAAEVVNYGVYVVAGEAAGLYGRIARGATDAHSESVAVLVTAS